MSLKVLQALLPIELLIAHGAKQTEKSDRKLWCGSVGMVHSLCTYNSKLPSYDQPDSADAITPLPWSNTRRRLESRTKTSFSLGLARLKLHLHDYSV
jgi:hypothetical protein